MKSFVGWMDSILSFVSAFILLFMMVITFSDVIGRSLLNQPVPGAFELTELLLLAVIFSGLPRACRTNAHINVTVLSGHFSSRINNWLVRVFALIGAVSLAAISWSMVNLGIEKIEFRDVTSFLGIPVGPVALLVSLLIGMSSLSEVIRAFSPNGYYKDDGHQEFE